MGCPRWTGGSKTVKACLIDTNLIIRFLTGEPEKQAESSKALFAANESGDLALKLVPLVLAEVVFVLSGKVYGYRRDEVASALIAFVQSPSLDVEKREVALLALALFRDYPIDYVDAYLAAEARTAGHAIASFDTDFRKIPKLDVKTP